MNNYVQLDDAKKIPLKVLPEHVPHDSFMGQTHLKVCEKFAALHKISDDLYGVYVNYLFTKSKLIKQVTSLVILMHARKLRIKSVTSNFITPEFSDILGKDIHIELIPAKPMSLIDTRQFCIFFFKVLTHRAYRFFYRQNLQAELITRAWVDTTDRVFPDIVHKSLLLIYPFNGNKIRQLRYLWLCMMEKRQYSLMGLNYKILDIPRILLNWKNRTELILQSEANAFKNHADDLILMGVKYVSTTDEFEMAGYLLHEKLIRNGVECHNVCHGIAVYGPYVNYSKISFYPGHQKMFYSMLNTFKNSETLSFASNKQKYSSDFSASQPVVVFIQGNWIQSGKVYEANFEKRAILLIEQLCKDLAVPFMLKTHPNIRYQWFKNLTSNSTITSMKSLKNKRFIFINIQSTAYYSLMQYGPTIFLEDDLLRPQKLFGELVDSVRLENLNESLIRYCNYDWWLNRYHDQFLSSNEKK